MNMVPSEAGDPVAVLRDRIYRAGAGASADGGAPPPFPFPAEDVSATPSGAVLQTPLNTLPCDRSSRLTAEPLRCMVCPLVRPLQTRGAHQAPCKTRGTCWWVRFSCLCGPRNLARVDILFSTWVSLLPARLSSHVCIMLIVRRGSSCRTTRSPWDCALEQGTLMPSLSACWRDRHETVLDLQDMHVRSWQVPRRPPTTSAPRTPRRPPPTATTAARPWTTTACMAMGMRHRQRRCLRRHMHLCTR